MYYSIVYVGMDVHKENFSLCAFTIEADKGKHHQRTEADFKIPVYRQEPLTGIEETWQEVSVQVLCMDHAHGR